MKAVFLTIGPLGALRPMLALAVEMRDAGHEVVIGSHKNYRSLVEERGVGFSAIASDSSMLASDRSRDSQFSSAGNPLKYFKALRIEAGELRNAAIKVFDRALDLCRGCDVVIYHAHMYVGAAIATHLGVVGIQAYNTPVTPTSEFPSYIRFRHSRKTSAFSNRLSFLMRDLITWWPYRNTINQWLRETFDLPPIGMMGPYREMDPKKCMLLYSISPSMLRPPDDWPAGVHMTGYWQLPELTQYCPPKELERFLAAGDIPVCIGFGSMSYGDVEALTRVAIDAIRELGCRAVLLSGRQGLQETSLPDSIYMCEEVSHEWLFERVSISVNAGGIGTLTAALRAGLPSVVVPFGGDNLFWGWQIERLGVGPEPVPVKKLDAALLASRMKSAMECRQYREVALGISCSMKNERGVKTAVKLVEENVSRH